MQGKDKQAAPLTACTRRGCRGRCERGGNRFAPGFLENGAGYSPPGKRGHDFIHVAVDDHSRYAYVEALPDERGHTTAATYDGVVKPFPSRLVDPPKLHRRRLPESFRDQR